MIKMKRLTDTAILPNKAHFDDAGFDVFADEDITIGYGETVMVSTGIAMAIPIGYYGKLKCRSGYSAKTRLRVIEGTIDAGYRGEVKVICELKAEIFRETPSFEIKKGDKIAQLIIQEAPSFEIEEVAELDCTNRGECGFGSSGY